MPEDSEVVRGTSGTQNQVLLAEPMRFRPAVSLAVASRSLVSYPGVSLVSYLDLRSWVFIPKT